LRKVGKAFVEVEVGDDDNKGKKKGRKRGMTTETADNESEDALSKHEEEGPEDATMDARAQRLARRKLSTPTTPSARKHIAVRSKNGQASGSKIKTPSANEDKARQPVGTSTAVPGEDKSAIMQPAEAAVEYEDKKDGAQNPRKEVTDSTQAAMSILETVGPEVASHCREESGDLMGDSAGHETSGQESITDEQTQAIPEAEMFRKDQKPSIEESRDTLPEGCIEASAGKDEESIETAEDTYALAVRHEPTSEAVNEQDLAASRETLDRPSEEENNDGVQKIPVDNADSATSASHVDLQTPEHTLHEVEALPDENNESGTIEAKLQESTNVIRAGSPNLSQSPLESSPQPAPTMNIVPEPSPGANHTQHPATDPALRLPATSAAVDPKLDGSG